MKANIEEMLEKQATWQKLRKTSSWGDKIRQAEIARKSLGSYGYRAVETNRSLWSPPEKANNI